MRCARGRVEGMGVRAHTRVVSVGGGRALCLSLSLLFSPRDDGKNTSSREEALLFRREDPFRPSANPSFVSFRLLFFFFSNRPPSFLDRLPTGKGWKPRGRETAAPLPRFSARLVIISRYYPVCISLSFVAIALAARQINWNLSPIRVYMHVRVI